MVSNFRVDYSVVFNRSSRPTLCYLIIVVTYPTECPILVVFYSPELLKGDASIVDGSNLHKRCQDDYQQLKEEYERYKLRAQSVLKNKATKVR